MDCFCRADIDAGLAVDAHILVDFRLVILHRDGRRRTFAYTGFTSGTLTVVNDCCQIYTLHRYIGEKTKKGFRCYIEDPGIFPGSDS